MSEGRLTAYMLSRPNGTLAREVIVKDKTGSTNDDARALGDTGSAHGTVVIAEEQESGRGRLGRSWHSAAGLGLYFSVLLRPTLKPDKVGLVTIAAGVGAAKAVADVSGLDAQIKWPNDVRVGGKKLCGILAEAHGRGAVDFVVLGIGINVNHDRDDLPRDLREIATSLRMESGRKFERAAAFKAVMERLEEALVLLEADGRERLLKEWSSLSEATGRLVAADTPEGRREGVVVGIREDGALLLDERGARTAVIAGDVTIL